MIRVISDGAYSLIGTKDHVKILTLDSRQFVWLVAGDIGEEILVTSHNPHKVDYLLALGKYRLYDVKDEPKFVDQQHLELHVGSKKWQGYLLPTGLPSSKNKRARIIAAQEVISVPTDQD